MQVFHENYWKYLHNFLSFLPDSQPFSCSDTASLDSVQPSELGNADAILGCYASQRISLTYPVINSFLALGFLAGSLWRIGLYGNAACLVEFRLVVIDRVFFFDKTTDHAVGQTECIRFGADRDDVFLELRVERT